MSTWVYPDHSFFGSATAYGLGTVETPRYGGLYLGRRRDIYGSRPHQLFAGDYAASPPMLGMNSWPLSGIESLRGVARALAARGIPTPRGGAWSPVQVSAILQRAKVTV